MSAELPSTTLSRASRVGFSLPSTRAATCVLIGTSSQASATQRETAAIVRKMDGLAGFPLRIASERLVMFRRLSNEKPTPIAFRISLYFVGTLEARGSHPKYTAKHSA